MKKEIDKLKSASLNRSLEVSGEPEQVYTKPEIPLRSYASAVTGSESKASPEVMTAIPSARLDRDRRFNLIVHGIKESPRGTLRQSRLETDTKAVSIVFSSIHSSFTALSLRDCYRLGKYVF